MYLYTQSIYPTPLQIRQVINAQNIRIYKPPLESDDEASDHARLLIDAMPFSIIGSTDDVKTADGRIVKGREYLWGVAEGSSKKIRQSSNANTGCS